jgi:hypothetical protein
MKRRKTRSGLIDFMENAAHDEGVVMSPEEAKKIAEMAEAHHKRELEDENPADGLPAGGILPIGEEELQNNPDHRPPER